MSSLRDEGVVDTNYLIRLFLDTPAEETPHVGASLLARLAEGTIAVFQDIQKSPIDGVKGDSESQSYLVSLGRSSDRLRLWSDGYGISSGASDDLFERSSRLRGATLEILSSIGLTLIDSKSEACRRKFQVIARIRNKANWHCQISRARSINLGDGTSRKDTLSRELHD